MQDLPLVSVLMSAYNGERFLRGAVESILRQSLRDLELIVINDGSTDATGEILDKCQEGDPARSRLPPSERGIIESLNRGAGFARGEYIARMDADDSRIGDRLALQMSVLAKHQELGVVGGAIEVMNASGNQD